jgi:hypothetical protein
MRGELVQDNVVKGVYARPELTLLVHAQDKEQAWQAEACAASVCYILHLERNVELIDPRGAASCLFSAIFTEVLR